VGVQPCNKRSASGVHSPADPMGVFETIAFERGRSRDPAQVETAVVMIKAHIFAMVTVAELARYRFQLEYEETLAIAS
jgi:hypothetical protein